MAQAGVGAGVGNAMFNPTAVRLVSNTSTVSGLLMVRTSPNGLPVEIPKGTTIRPAVRYGGNFCGSPSVMYPRSTVTRSTPAEKPDVVGKITSVPGLYWSIRFPLAQSLALISNSKSA